MNKRPGQIKVTVETGFCSFCDRTRNLRREERQLGALVRTVTSCESCHRVLSSTIGVAEPEAAVESKKPRRPSQSRNGSRGQATQRGTRAEATGAGRQTKGAGGQTQSGSREIDDAGEAKAREVDGPIGRIIQI